jgi:penicillin-binding protein 1C
MSPYSFQRFQKKVTSYPLLKAVKRLTILSGCSFLLFLLLNFLFPLKDELSYSTLITDEKGEVLHAFLTPDQKWRMKTELQEIAPLLRKAILAKEDRYFYRHPGVNPLAVARAAFNNLVSGRRTSGASTITMQVARALEPRRRTFFAKLAEAFRAFQLEWKYSKEEILQLYLNLVPYGGNIEGVKAASLIYFRKYPDHLSLAEITALSIIPNRPSSLVIGRSNALIVEERNRWLRRFAATGTFSEKEIRDALAEPLEARRNALPREVPHLANRLRKANPAEPSIRTFIRLNTQQKVEKLTLDYIRTLRAGGIRNAAVLVIDNTTRQVIAYAGSASFSDTTDGGQVDGVTAVRQPGSTLKPLLYGMAMDEGWLTPRKVVLDVPVSYAGYAPENYDRNFNGQVTVEEALAQSLNIPAVNALRQLGKEKFAAMLAACRFRQVAADKPKLGLSMILGGCGASLEELTSLFAAFANEGSYTEAALMPSKRGGGKVQVLSPSSAYLITEMLARVNRPDFPLNWRATEHMPRIAWKTGTSYGRRDAWSIGYNKRYTIGVWVGNFSGQGVPELSGANTATPLLFRIFNSVDYNPDGDWFLPPDDCLTRTVCADTGLPPGPHCTNKVSDLYIPLVSTTQSCTHLKEVKIAADGKTAFCEGCAPASGFKTILFNDLTPEVREYYVQRGKKLNPLPPHNPDCERIFRGEGPVITFPQHQTEYLISKKEPEPLQLAARAGSEVSSLYWYIDDQFYKKSKAGEKQFFLPPEGAVKISCTDDKGRSRTIRITVKYVGL